MSRGLAVGVVLVALGCMPAEARAQDRVSDGGAERGAVTTIPATKHTLLTSLYVSTATLQALDLQSTVSALRQGGLEANPMVSPIAGHPAAFVAAKSAVAVSTIFAAHRLSNSNKAAAVAMLLAVNSAYAIVVAHNYRIGAGR